MFGTFRTALALMVVAQHLGGAPRMGAYAVFGFYVLSGYLMSCIMHRDYGHTPAGAARYLLNRFLRIYPIYWLSIGLSALLIALVGEQFATAYRPTLYLPGSVDELARNILIFFPARAAPRLIPPAWALTVELCFYILIGLGLSKTKKSVIVWFAASVAYHVVAVTAQFGWPYQYFAIPSASLPFATGALIFHFGASIPQYFRRALDLTGAWVPLVLVGIILANWLGGWLTGRSTGIFFYSNYVLCSLAVAGLSEIKPSSWLTRRFDKRLGDLSYPIYLVHFLAGLTVFYLYHALGIGVSRHGAGLVLSSLPLILAVSGILAAGVERPLDVVRARIKQRSSPSAQLLS